MVLSAQRQARPASAGRDEGDKNDGRKVHCIFIFLNLSATSDIAADIDLRRRHYQNRGNIEEARHKQDNATTLLNS